MLLVRISLHRSLLRTDHEGFAEDHESMAEEIMSRAFES